MQQAVVSAVVILLIFVATCGKAIKFQQLISDKGVDVNKRTEALMQLALGYKN